MKIRSHTLKVDITLNETEVIIIKQFLGTMSGVEMKRHIIETMGEGDMIDPIMFVMCSLHDSLEAVTSKRIGEIER